MKYYSVKPEFSGKEPISLIYQEHKDELFLSAHVRLCGLDRMAYIESESLANQFAKACTPRLQKRYGDDTVLTVIDFHESERKWLLKRIEQDSEIVRKRIETDNFAPNKTP